MSVRSASAVMFVCCALGAVVAPDASASGLDISGYSLSAVKESGSADAQAGSHPFEVRADVAFNGNGDTLEDLHLALPTGMGFDPLSTPQCSVANFAANSCPNSAAVGVVTVTIAGTPNLVPVYNVIPAVGQAMRFGFEVGGANVFIEGLVRPGDDGLTLSLSQIPPSISPEAIALTLWGWPADAAHDAQRGTCLGKSGSSCPAGASPAVLITLPTSCTATQDTLTEASADPWQAPGSWSTAPASFPAMSGCARLSFAPAISVMADATQVDEPSGYSIGVSVPQSEDALGLASSQLQSVSVTLPVGSSLSLSATNGLSGCEEAQAELTASGPGTCPDSSKVGVVKIETPLLAKPLEGAVFLATPYANPLEALVSFYVIAQEPVGGVTVKLMGRMDLNQATGQPTLSFERMPQLPISHIELHFFGGERALIANPPTCGTATSTGELIPWSGEATIVASSQFEVGWGSKGEACPSAFPFEPKLAAEPTSPQEGSATPLELAVSREGLQSVSKLTFQLPAGLVWGFSSVSACGEPQAAQGACPLSSMIGTAVLGLGTGRSLAWLIGPVFLTGGYGGAQYGVSIPFEAFAGPFELDQVVVRAAVAQNASTGALSIATDPLPRILDGIPLQTRALELAIDKPGFVVSPTTCQSQQIAATVEGSQGTTVDLPTPFAAQGCSPAPAAASQPPPPPPAAPGRVTILSSKIVIARGTARIKLRCEAAPCAGKLKLQLKDAKRGHGRRRNRTVTIGVATYSITAGETVIVTMHLERVGLRRLRARRGRLPATVLLTSASGQREAKAVQLLEQRPHKRRKTA